MVPHGSSIEVVLVLCASLQTVYACLWLGAARMRLAPRSALRWGVGTLLGAVAMAIVLARPWLDAAFGWIAPNLLNVLAALMLLQGVQSFLRLRSDRREAATVMALALIGIAAPVLLLGLNHPMAIISNSLLMGWCLARAGLAAVPDSPIGHGLSAGGGANLLLAVQFLVGSLLINVALWSMLMVRLVIRLRYLSMHDTLTRLLNRRGFEEALRTERQRERRDGTPHAVLLVDIDHFKRINDTHGHAAGDAVLVSVAQRLRAELRAIDRIGRVGGEEFAVLLPGTPTESAIAAAERLRAAVSGEPHAVVGHAVAVTVSIGVAEMRHIEPDAAAAWQRADTALYRAKSEGRDRVIQAA
jgi:diguanylate cyclase (GGDEF)-like protein